MEPACNLDALKRLRAARFDVMEVVHVDPDSILYLNSRGEAMTAWGFAVECEGGTPSITYRIERGFSVEPSLRIYP